MKLISFNVNGLRSRLHQLTEVVARHNPDVIGLQETKVEDALFPMEEIHRLGYQAIYHGQKGHYGVALLYKADLLASSTGFPHDGEASQKRLVSITLPTANGPLTIYNGYFPQGESRDHPEKFPNKRNFYRDLLGQLKACHSPTDNIVVMGDMNVAPLDTDIGIGEENRKRWLRTGKCCFLPEEREWLASLMAWGLTDSYEAVHQDSGEQRYSWFDYRSKGFEQDPKRGLRIDMILATQPIISRLTGVGIDQDIRALEKPSDHCPIWLEADL